MRFVEISSTGKWVTCLLQGGRMTNQGNDDKARIEKLGLHG